MTPNTPHAFWDVADRNSPVRQLLHWTLLNTLALCTVVAVVFLWMIIVISLFGAGGVTVAFIGVPGVLALMGWLVAHMQMSLAYRHHDLVVPHWERLGAISGGLVGGITLLSFIGWIGDREVSALLMIALLIAMVVVQAELLARITRVGRLWLLPALVCGGVLAWDVASGRFDGSGWWQQAVLLLAFYQLGCAVVLRHVAQHAQKGKPPSAATP